MKKFFRFSLIVSLVLSLVLLSLPVSTFADGDRNSGQVDEWVLVKFQDGTDENAKHEVSLRHGDTDEGELAGIGVHRIKIHAGNLSEKLRSYSEEKSVKYAEPDYIATAISTPNDQSFGSQWGMTKIQAPQAWDVTTGQPTVKIAILDTGIDQNHPDLASKIVANRNFTTSPSVDDLYGHGTHVAGVAAAATNNTLGVAGVGFNSTLMNVKVLSDTGSGNYSWIASGIIWATDNGAKVISMSLGGSGSSATLQDAVNYAWSRGVVIVAAAGNNGNSGMVYPGAYQNVIAVAATDPNDSKASFSEYGSWVDVAAPGVSIYSTFPNHTNQFGALNYGSLSGTSMATPFVAGLAALVWTTPYGTTNTDVRNRIENTADRITGTGTYWQSGRINAYQAVSSTPPPPPRPRPRLPIQLRLLKSPGLV